MNAAAFVERVNVQTDWLEETAERVVDTDELAALDPMELLSVLGSLARLITCAHMIAGVAGADLTRVAAEALGQ